MSYEFTPEISKQRFEALLPVIHEEYRDLAENEDTHKALKQEFEAYAPAYFEIFQSLTGNDIQKFVFSGLDLFEDWRNNYIFDQILARTDKDAHSWSIQGKIAASVKHLAKLTRDETHMLTARADITFGDLITQGSDGRHRFIDGVLGMDWLSRSLKANDTDKWHPQLCDITADNGTIIDFLVYRSTGATKRLIGVDPETGHLAFGDQMHSFKYDHLNQQIIGTLGASAFRLDEMGRFADLTKEEKLKERYLHLF